MPSFQIVNSLNQATYNSCDWKPAAKFNSKNQKTNKDGIDYIIITKEVKTTNIFVRIACIFLSILMLGTPLIFKKLKRLKNICLKGKESVRFAIPLVSFQNAPAKPIVSKAVNTASLKKAEEQLKPQLPPISQQEGSVKTSKTSAPNLQKAIPEGDVAQDDCLSISKFDAAIFAFSVAQWTAQLLPVRSINAQLLLDAIKAGKYATILSSMSVKSIVPLLAMTGLSALSLENSSVSLALNTLITADLAYQTFQGLRSCWRSASLNPKKALIKALVSYSPKVAVSFNNLREIGAQFGILEKPNNGLEELVNRDLKCLQTTSTKESRKTCLNLSLKIYNDCSSSTYQCKSARIKYDDYLKRVSFFDFAKSTNICSETKTYNDCKAKYDDYSSKCNLDFNSDSCKTADKILLDGVKNGFKSDLPEIKPEESSEQPTETSGESWKKLQETLEEIFEKSEKAFEDLIQESLKGLKEDLKAIKDSFEEFWKNFRYQKGPTITSKDCENAFQTLMDKRISAEEISKIPTIDIKRAFKRKSFEAHPDKPTGSTEKMQKITNAYDLLIKQCQQ